MTEDVYREAGPASDATLPLKPESRFLALDGLRGAAALIVVFGHLLGAFPRCTGVETVRRLGRVRGVLQRVGLLFTSSSC